METKHLIGLIEEQAKEVDKKEAVHAVSLGTRLFIEFWGIILLILTFSSYLTTNWARIGTFIVGAFLFIRGRQLDG